jgi:hypothetical protein
VGGGDFETVLLKIFEEETAAHNPAGIEVGGKTTAPVFI